MRLKSMDGPLSVHNGNHNVLNSPKRINTVQNSNVTTVNHYNSQQHYLTETHLIDNNDALTSTQRTADDTINIDATPLNNINNADVQWCNVQPARELTKNTNNIAHPQHAKSTNRHSFNNINNSTLAVSLRTTGSERRIVVGTSICSESSSPDDSLLDYEEAPSSSADASPQDEERPFDIELSDSDSDDGNLNLGRGIVNPNYPGFQHLAHTLEYGIKCISDSEDDYADIEDANLHLALPDHANVNTNLNNNNNNNEDDTSGLQNDKIDSVNRLDSVENIQKVFYDKPVYNITCDGAPSEAGADLTGSTNSNCEEHIADPEKPEITVEDIKESISCDNIVGNFGEEVEREFGRIAIERAIERELEEACEKLALVDLQPTATKYNIEPNIEQPFNKAFIIDKPILHDAIIVKNTQFPEKQKQQCDKMAEVANFNCHLQDEMKLKLSDAFLSSVQDKIPDCEHEMFKMEVANSLGRCDSNRELVEGGLKEITQIESMLANKHDEIEKFCKEDQTKGEKEKDEDSAVPRKKEKMETYVKKRRDYNQQIGSLITIPRRELTGRGRENLNRRSLPLSVRDKKKSSPEILGGFDVYNIETAMPKIDLEVIESHLRAAREEERRRRTDREEIRRRLAMGNEDDYYNGCDRPGRKPSLQARLQSGMNLQICFMNETASDTESPSSDSECTLGKPKQAKPNYKKEEEKSLPPVRPATLSIGLQQPQSLPATMNETDFFAKQARLQTEARMALAQAKEMARMQMEIERQRQKKSPITEMVRHSMEKVGIPFPEDRRRLSRQILTEMNVAQLQVIVNDLHTQIEILNESLVKFLMARDDLHMEQDSMLVDIEDLTRFLGAKEQIIKEHNLALPSNNNASPPSPAPSSPLSAINSSVKPHLNRIASLVKK